MQDTMHQTVIIVHHRFCDDITFIGAFGTDGEAHTAVMTAAETAIRADGVTDPTELRESIVHFVESCTFRRNVKIGVIATDLKYLV